MQRLSKFFSTTPAFYSSPIKNRSLLLVHGPDMSSVLQGITTTNFETFLENSNIAGQHTCFLNSKGKILSEALIIKPLTLVNKILAPRTDLVWLDLSKFQTKALLSHLSRYSFKKKLEVIDITGGIEIRGFYVIEFLSE